MLGAATAIGFPLRLYTGVLTSYLRYDLIAYFSIGRAVLSATAIYYVLALGFGITAVAAVSVVASFLQNGATYGACRIIYPQVRVVSFRFDAPKTRMMFDYGWKTFVCQLGDIVRFRLDAFVIAAFLNVGLLTPYSIGLRLVEGFCQLLLNSVGMMLPVFSQYEGRGDQGAIRSALLMTTRVSAFLSAFVGLSVIFYAPALIRRWMGPGFESSAVVAAILCVGFILELPQSPGIQLLYGLSKHEYYAALSVGEGVLNLALSLILLRRFGMYGVALGTTVELVLVKLSVQPVYICRAVQLPVRVYLVDVILGTLAKTALPLGLFFFAIRGFVLADYGRIGACLAVQCLVFAPIAYFFVIGGAERDLLARVLRLDEAFVALGRQQRPVP
jgi:O-antigen/teichoic acid export membrane protein